MKQDKYEKLRSRKFKPLLLLLSLLILVGVGIGTTAAILMDDTDGVTNQFQAGTVGCQIHEVVSDNEKTGITVENTGDVPVYVRVRLVTYWTNSAGQIIGKSSPALNVTLADGWISGPSNTYYYSRPVTANSTTPNLLDAPLTMVQDEAGNIQVIEVLAESIQSQPSGAAQDAWGVTVNADGTISIGGGA